MMDPYAELGVRKNANKATIKNAYRLRSKAAHPDGGGSAERFGALNLAYKVLSDDDRRKKYDTTGVIDEVAPDNTEAAIVNIIAGMLEQIILGDQDPMASDLVGGMQNFVNKQIETIQQMNAKLERARGRIVTMSQRFKIKKGENKIAMILRARLASLDAALESNKRNIELHREVHRRLGQYTFERMVQQYVHQVSFMSNGFYGNSTSSAR